MDPISQGALGAVVPQATVPGQPRGRHLALAGLAGFLSGMAADLDILIRSSHDPLIYLQYHRQFTHSLVFVPVGGLVCAALFWTVTRRWLTFGTAWRYCTLGYATHGLLDSCTSYGTQLLWPFSDVRVTWNSVSIVDPLFTLPLVVCVGIAAWRGERRWARAGLLWAVLYLALGVVQRERAESAGRGLAESRGHSPEELVVKPSFGNLILWKVVYATDADLHVDAVRVAIGRQAFPGSRIAKLELDRDLPWVSPQSTAASDIERFRWFSDGFIARHPEHDDHIIDVRYSMVPNEIEPLWGIRLFPDDPDRHADFVTWRQATADKRQRLWLMLKG